MFYTEKKKKGGERLTVYTFRVSYTFHADYTVLSTKSCSPWWQQLNISTACWREGGSPSSQTKGR